MRKGREVLGKRVVAADTGDRLGRVADLILDERRNHVIGFVLASRWRHNARVLPFGEVEAIGPDAVLARTRASAVRPKDVTDIARSGGHAQVLAGKHVMTDDGRRLGSLVDVWFDDRSGEIGGYAVATRRFGGFVTRRLFMPAPETMTVGKDFALVPATVTGLIEEKTGDAPPGRVPDTSHDST
jgi:uncharacterized protein YrrD